MSVITKSATSINAFKIDDIPESTYKSLIGPEFKTVGALNYIWESIAVFFRRLYYALTNDWSWNNNKRLATRLYNDWSWGQKHGITAEKISVMRAVFALLPSSCTKDFTDKSNEFKHAMIHESKKLTPSSSPSNNKPKQEDTDATSSLIRSTSIKPTAIAIQSEKIEDSRTRPHLASPGKKTSGELANTHTAPQTNTSSSTAPKKETLSQFPKTVVPIPTAPLSNSPSSAKATTPEPTAPAHPNNTNPFPTSSNTVNANPATNTVSTPTPTSEVGPPVTATASTHSTPPDIVNPLLDPACTASTAPTTPSVVVPSTAPLTPPEQPASDTLKNDLPSMEELLRLNPFDRMKKICEKAKKLYENGASGSDIMASFDSIPFQSITLALEDKGWNDLLWVNLMMEIADVYFMAQDKGKDTTNQLKLLFEKLAPAHKKSISDETRNTNSTQYLIDFTLKGNATAARWLYTVGNRKLGSSPSHLDLIVAETYIKLALDHYPNENESLKKEMHNTLEKCKNLKKEQYKETSVNDIFKDEDLNWGESKDPIFEMNRIYNAFLLPILNPSFPLGKVRASQSKDFMEKLWSDFDSQLLIPLKSSLKSKNSEDDISKEETILYNLLLLSDAFAYKYKKENETIYEKKLFLGYAKKILDYCLSLEQDLQKLDFHNSSLMTYAKEAHADYETALASSQVKTISKTSMLVNFPP